MATPNQHKSGPKPAYPVCKFTDIAAFRPGVWNGETHTADFNRLIVANFKRFSSGPSPYYQPYVSVNHKDEFAAGFVSGARLNGDVLTLDADDVPEMVGQLRASGAIRQPSIEYFKPKRDEAGNLIDGFRGPDGKIVDGPVLKCLTLLGADSPAVKGLPPLPYATFSQRGPTARFGVVPMDRAAMIAALQALGADVSSVTEATPDEVVKAWLESLQAAKGNVPTTTDTPAEVPAMSAMADVGNPTGQAGALLPAPTAAPALPGVPTGAQPSSVVLKFADTTPAQVAAALEPIRAQTQAWVNALASQVAAGVQTQAALNRQNHQQAHAAKFADVTAFVGRLAAPDGNGQVRITPAQKPGLVALLMKCDSITVRKFSDGKTTGSELDEMKANLSATLPKMKFGGEKLPAATGPTTGNGAGGSGGPGIDPERRRAMLAATPQGRNVLALEAKK